MGKLQILDINGAPLVKLTQQDGANKSNLHYLDLSGSRVTALPSGFFCEMLNLEELILCNCFSLTKLPLSIAQLSNLLVLHVQGTQITTFPEDMFEAMQNLHTLNLTNNMLLLSLPRSLSEAKGLKELHIYNCVSLGSQFLQELTPYVEHLYIQTWDALEHIKILGHPNLTTFTLSGQWVRSLSLNGCSKLKIMNIGDELMALEDVDLSGTALEEVPHNLPNLPQLRMLLLLNVPCLKRFPWHLLVRFPKVFYLDHCTGYHNWFPKMSCSQKIYADGNQYAEKAVNTAQVNITDSRIFYSFNRDVATKLVKEGRFLQSFNVQVKSCSARGKETKMKQGERIQRQSPYLDVHSDEAASIVPMIKLQPRQRHVEISANNQCPQGLRHLLSVTNSIFLIDDTFVECLTDLNYSLMWLEECQIEHCHQMTVVLRMSSESEGSESLSSLKILQASNLNLLQSFVEPAIMSDSSLITLEQLKHIHLEHCPQLEKIFPCSLSLPALETLVILFCSSLKTIFYNQTRYEVAPSPLPNIKSIYLQELPQLQHIHDDVMFRFQSPKLEKLFLRGCQSFHRLPLLNREYLKPKVEVNGERDWWDKLQMTLPEQSGYYVHVPASEFVSCKKHIIESYLR
jgi:Leucine-rich repeat (LRR) protein